MEDIISFLTTDICFIIGIIFDILALIFYFILTLKNKDTKAFKEVIEEMKKYRTENYQDTERAKGQTFDLYRKVYKLNPITNELEETLDQVDIQAIIESALPSTMTAILERLMPQPAVTSEEVSVYSAIRDDLEILNSFSEKAEYYKEKLGLDSSLSISQVFEAVKQKSDELKVKISSNKEVKPDEKKEEA